MNPKILPAIAIFVFSGILLCDAQNNSSLLDERISIAAEALRPKLIEQRRDFHTHPELSNREVRTARVIAERLRDLGLDEIRTNVAHHGIVALLKGKKPGPIVAVRADFDALPINETINVPYKSQNPGVKHACGHDVHTTIELGVAEILSQMRDAIPGTIKFIFQPAEEGAPTGEEGGATLMIKEGAMENPKPIAIFGMHCTPELRVGKIGFRAGPAQASADMFDIVIRGKMSHAMAPQDGVDSIVVAAECITALQSIKSRRVDPFEPFILTIGTIHGGTKRNIISPEVKLEGTLRTLNETVRSRVKEEMKRTLAGVTSAYGASYELQMHESTLVVVNDPKLVAETLPVMRRVIGETNVVEVPQRMGAEDMSYFLRLVPGFYFRLGTGNPEKGIVAQIHTPEFDVDEDCLVVGTKVMANVLLNFLEQNAPK